MASNDDILVPDFTYFIENDLRRAIQELDESSSIDPIQPISVLSPSTGSDSTASTSTSAASRTNKKKSKKKKQTPDDGKVRKFVSPYAVFADIRLKAQKAAEPDKQTAIIWKETAKEWGRMTRIEKAPYVKEFENRRRLYELENPNATFKTPGRPSQGGRTVFRFAPYRKSKDSEVSRIEHLPQCPILTKRKIYEEAILEPLQPAKQYGRSNSLQKEVPTTAIASPTSPATSPACNGCPRVFSVCDYCRGLGFEGRRILHFESDCWTKARHKRNQRFKVQNPQARTNDRVLAPLWTRQPPRTTSLQQNSTDNGLKALLFGHSMHPNEKRKVSTEGEKTVEDHHSEGDLNPFNALMPCETATLASPINQNMRFADDQKQGQALGNSSTSVDDSPNALLFDSAVDLDVLFADDGDMVEALPQPSDADLPPSSDVSPTAFNFDAEFPDIAVVDAFLTSVTMFTSSIVKREGNWTGRKGES